MRPDDVFERRDRTSGELRGAATLVAFDCASNAQLRAIAEVDASRDAQPAFVRAFVAAPDNVMHLARLDFACARHGPVHGERSRTPRIDYARASSGVPRSGMGPAAISSGGAL